MKKTLLTALITVALFACQKGLDDPKPKIHYGTVIFYTLNDQADKQWEVYIDSSSNSAGLVPYTVIEPSCDSSGALGLHVSLQEGTHTALLKSLQGFPSRSEDITVGDGCQTFR